MMNANNARSQLAELTSSVLWPVTPAALHSEPCQSNHHKEQIQISEAEAPSATPTDDITPHANKRVWRWIADPHHCVVSECHSDWINAAGTVWKRNEMIKTGGIWRSWEQWSWQRGCSQCTVAFCSCPAPLRAAEDQSYYSGWQERIRKGSLPRERATHSQPDERKREGNTVRGWAPIRQGPQMDGGCDSHQEWIIMAGKVWSEGVNSDGRGRLSPLQRMTPDVVRQSCSWDSPSTQPSIAAIPYRDVPHKSASIYWQD